MRAGENPTLDEVAWRFSRRLLAIVESHDLLLGYPRAEVPFSRAAGNPLLVLAWGRASVRERMLAGYDPDDVERAVAARLPEVGLACSRYVESAPDGGIWRFCCVGRSDAAFSSAC